MEWVSGTAIRLDGIWRRFAEIVALADFDLEVPRGSITMLLGPNGAGKTTALRIVTGAMRADAGTIEVLGGDPRVDGADIRRRIGVVPAKPALYDRLTGADNLDYAASLYGVANADHAVNASAARFGIEHALAQRVGGYSTGMKARLALARATLHDPELLLLDEPTAGLDPESSRAVLGLIGEMASAGRTVLMSTHLLLEAEGLAHHVLVMDRGHTLVSGHPRELTRRYWERPTVLVEALEPAGLDAAQQFDFVVSYTRDSDRALIEVDDPTRVASLVERLTALGVRLVRVEPREPTLEELYFAVRQEQRADPGFSEQMTGDVPMVPEGSRTGAN